MKVYAKLFRPPVTPYWSLSVACGGEFIVAQLHWDGDTCEKEFESMESFFAYCKAEKIRVPWLGIEEQPWLTPEGEKDRPPCQPCDLGDDGEECTCIVPKEDK